MIFTYMSCPSATGLGMNPGLHGQKLMTNLLSHSMAFLLY